MPAPTSLPYRRRWNRRKILPEIAPPGPPAAHVTDLERVGQTVLRFSFDTPIVDLGDCGDLRVDGEPPVSVEQIGGEGIEATYAVIAPGAAWSARVMDGEPMFENDAILGEDGGTVPAWG